MMPAFAPTTSYISDCAWCRHCKVMPAARIRICKRVKTAGPGWTVEDESRDERPYACGPSHRFFEPSEAARQ